MFKKNIFKINEKFYELNDEELIHFFADYYSKFPFDTQHNSFVYDAIKLSYPIKANLIKNNIKAPCFGLDFFRDLAKNKISIEKIKNNEFNKLIKYSPNQGEIISKKSVGFGDFLNKVFHVNLKNKVHAIIKIKNSSAFISSTGCTVFNHEGSYIDGICNSDGVLYANINFMNLPNSLKLKGRSVLLCSAWSNGYFHWILEVMPRILLINKIIDDLTNFDYFIVRQKNFYTLEFFNKLGINEDKIIDISKTPYIIFEELIVTDSFENYFRNNTQESIPIEPWISQLLQSYFPIEEKSQPVKKIYIDRNNSLIRKVINYNEVKKILIRHGFQIFQFEEISLNEKISLMQNAKFIISPAGAGLANIVFCMPKTSVLIFYNSEYLTDSFYSICQNNNLNHFHLMTEPSRFYFDTNYPNSINEDFLINLEQLENTLLMMLNED